MRKTEKGDYSVMDLENFTKYYQVINSLDTIYDLLRYFVHKLTLAYNEKMEKGDNFVMDLENFTKG